MTFVELLFSLSWVFLSCKRWSGFKIYFLLVLKTLVGKGAVRQKRLKKQAESEKDDEWVTRREEGRKSCFLPSSIKITEGLWLCQSSHSIFSPNRRGNATLGSSGVVLGAVQSFLPHPEPHWQGHPGPTSGPAGYHSRGQRALSVLRMQWRLSPCGPWIIDTLMSLGPGRAVDKARNI